MTFAHLREQTFLANQAIVKAGLVVLTWGNASVAQPENDVFAIKPSGVAYDTLTPADIVVLSISTGQVVDGDRRPSSDTPTHWHLYQKFPQACRAVVHTHSTHGTVFAQALRDIPCLGTTHADNFHGPIPVTRPMTQGEIADHYELNTGRVIVDTFTSRNIDPAHVPGVLVAHHAPFAWGPTATKAVENAIVLEFSAQMALHTLALSPTITDIPRPLLDKHYFRKHGAGAYYGQPAR